MCIDKRQHGLTLVELIMFIVVVSIGVVGILQVWSTSVRGSADPLAYKQALAIAEALLEEIELQPFTVCDPTDPAASFAINAASCTVLAEGFGPELEVEGVQQRGSVTRPLNNVNDYGGNASGVPNALMLNGILDQNGTPIAALQAYSATVTITNDPLGSVPAAESLRIDVNVQGRGANVTLTGYRLQYVQTY